jgi:hypothetical protein
MRGLCRLGAARRNDDQCCNHAEVEQGRRKGGRNKSRHGIEHAREERHETDQKQIGKGDPRQEDRQIELLRRVDPFRGERPNESRHCQFEDEREQEKCWEEDGKTFLGKRAETCLVHEMQAGTRRRPRSRP